MASSYEPTPLEKAYASYLLDKIFQIEKDNDVIRIPGRLAVPFLTTSGVDRNILRNAWGVADPESIGKLKSREQFCVVLRLVALAQAGAVTSETTDLMGTLNESKEDVPLAAFESVELPPPASLLDEYSEPMHLEEPQPILSVSDAFGDLVHVEDAPLPVLPVGPPVDEVEDVEDDEFGDFEEADGENAAVTATAVVSDDELVEGLEETVTDNEDAAATQKVNANATLLKLADEHGDDALPEVESDPLNPPSGGSPVDRVTNDLFYSAHTEFSKSEQREENEADEADDFGDFTDAKEESSGNELGDLKEDKNGVDGAPGDLVVSGTEDGGPITGEVESGNAAESKSMMSLPEPVDDPFSAFDALAGPPAAAPELPPLGSFAPINPESESSAHILNTMGVMDQIDTQESFGDFKEGGVASTGDSGLHSVLSSNDSAAPGVSAVTSDDFGSFADSQFSVREHGDFGDFAAADSEACAQEQEVTQQQASKRSALGETFGDVVGGRDTTQDSVAGALDAPSLCTPVSDERQEQQETSFGDFEIAPPEGNDSLLDAEPTGVLDNGGPGGVFETTDAVVDGDTPTPHDNNSVDGVASTGNSKEDKDGSDFGDFEVVHATDVSPAVEQSECQEEFDDFGDFEGADAFSDSPPGVDEPAVTTQDSDNEGGEMIIPEGGFSGTSKGELSNVAGLPGYGDTQLIAPTMSDDFGDFTTADAFSGSLDAAQLETAKSEPVVDLCGQEETPSNVITDHDAFGDFEAAGAFDGLSQPAQAESATSNTETLFGRDIAASAEEPRAVQTDGQGEEQMVGFPEPSTDSPPEPSTDSPVDKVIENLGAPTEDDFGDFAAFDSGEAAENLVAKEQGNDSAPNTEPSDAFDADFGSFEFAAFDEEIKEDSLEQMREQIVASQSLLPSSLNMLDVIKNFESDGGGTGGWRELEERTKTDPGSAQPDVDRARRCHKLHMLLSSTHKRHVEYWTQLVSMVRDEMATCKLLMEGAKELSRVEQKQIVPSFETMVSGLAEYIRLVRLVVASIGDLLGLKVDAPLTSSTLKSRWHSLALLELALEAENLWDKTCQLVIELGIERPKVDSVPEIRKSCVHRGFSDEVCTLTLQPLSPDATGTTMAEVTWDGRKLMACAANFWSHKVSATVPC